MHRSKLFPRGGVRPVGALCTLALMICSAVGYSQIQTTPQPAVGGMGTLQGGTQPPRAGGHGPGDVALTAVPEDFSKLALAPGFLLDLQVYDMPELSSQLRVDDHGDIAVPMSGTAHVAGLTVTEAQQVISDKLKEAKILKNPQINLNVIQYSGASVTVLGEVQQPGRIPLLAPHSLPDVLAMVGGETPTAGGTVQIRRTVNGVEQTQEIRYARSGDSTDIKNVMVLPGDTVTVPRAGIVYVMGGVNRPGGYVMQENGSLNVAQALSLAYGTIMNAAVGSIRVVRKNPNGTTTEIPVPYKDITKGKAVPMALQAEDIVYVPISKAKTVLTAGATISTTSALIYTHY